MPTMPYTRSRGLATAGPNATTYKTMLTVLDDNKNGKVSKITGNAGARIACGETKLSSP